MMVNVLYHKCNRLLKPWDFHRYLESLPIPIQARIKNIKRMENAQASLFGKLLLGAGLKKCRQNSKNDSHIPNLNSDSWGDHVLLDLSYTKFNRPYLPGCEVDFNIAHSGQYVLCALTKNGLVGVDVEKITAIDLNEFHEQFSDAEMQRIKRSKNADHKFCFYWTIKEAVLKAQGVGLGIPLVNVVISEDETLARVFSKTWHLKALPLHRSYCACLATETKLEDHLVEVEEITTERLELFTSGSVLS